MIASRTIGVRVLIAAAAIPAGCWYDLSQLDSVPPDGPDADASSDSSSTDAAVELDAREGAAQSGETVAVGQTQVTGLAASATDLYWTTTSGEGAVMRCALAACGTPGLVSTGGSPTSIVWADRLFWGEQSNYGILAADDGVTHCDAFGVVDWVASSGTKSYYGHNGAIVQVQAWPCSSDNLVSTADAVVAAASGAAVAWVTSGGVVRYCSGSSCATSGAAIAQTDAPLAVAMDASSVFWTTRDGRVRRIDHDGSNTTGAPVDLAQGLHEPSAIAADRTSQNLYVTARGTSAAGYTDGVVVRLPKAGGSAVILADAQPRPEHLVLTATHVIWVDAYDGTIRRLTK